MPVRKFISIDKDSKPYLMRVGRRRRSRCHLGSLARIIYFFEIILF